MLTSTLIIGNCCILFLIWWQGRLREAEAASLSLQRGLESLGLGMETAFVRHVQGTPALTGRASARHFERSVDATYTFREVVRALHGIWLFSELDDRQIELIARVARQRPVRRGEVIVSQCDVDGGDLYCVLQGYFKVTTHGTRDREILINIIQRGESFGEIGFLDGKGGRSATVTALADGLVLEIRRAEVTRLLKEAPNVAIAMLTAQSRVLRKLTEHAEDNAFLDVRTRLAKRLVALAENLGTQLGPRTVELNVELTQEDLGDMVQASRTQVDEYLNDWADQGVIQRIDDRLIILEPQHLKDVARGVI